MSRNPDKMIERRSRILDILKQNGHAMVTELAEYFQTTPVTIRSDLTYLEAQGSLKRMAGGCVVDVPQEESALQKEFKSAAEKFAIARETVKLIQPGDTLFINAGTTTFAFAEQLPGIPRLSVVTNSLAIAQLLAKDGQIRVRLIGGEVNSEDGFTYGLDATETLSQYRAKYAVLSLDGLTLENGVSTLHQEEATVNKTMMKNADKCIMLADSSKIGRPGYFSFAKADEMDCLVTDPKVLKEDIHAFENAGIHVLIAEM